MSSPAQSSAAAEPNEIERLRCLSGAHFKLSNGSGLAAFWLQVAAVACATLPALRSAVPDWTPYLTAALAIVATLLRSASDASKSKADEILRRVEAADGAGARLHSREVADWWAEASPLVTWLAQRTVTDGAYFASQEQPSPRRTVMNTYESAWWSKHIARTQAGVTWIGIVLTFAAAILVLRIASSPKPVFDVGSAAVDAANAAILFLLTQAPIRRFLDLLTFHRTAARVVERAERLLTQNSISDIEAADLRTQYQLARRAAPALSTTLWRIRRPRLIALWTRIASQTGE